ncbi:MAG: DUF1290 domain-containing protein [Cyanobacteriota bacterium]
MWIPIIGLLIGLVVGGLLPVSIPIINTQINTILVITATDALFNGFLNKLEGKFSTMLFSIEFLLNTLLAIGIVYFGIIMGIDLFLAITIIFGVRIFHNLSQINQKLFIHR